MPATLADIQTKYGEAVYPLYKDQMHEPYMENDNGIGYKGVVMYDELEDKVQCSICGKWYGFLGRHLVYTHSLNSKEYKRSFLLSQNIPLCNKKKSTASSIEARKHIERLINASTKTRFIKGKISQNATKNYVRTYTYKNKHGLCDAQIQARLIICRDMANKSDLSELLTEEIEKFDRNLLEALKKRYGTRKKIAEVFKIKFINREQYEDSKLISSLRMFVIKNKYIPASSELEKLGLAYYQTYQKYFGSWRRAKMMAGLDQLLQEVKSEKTKNI